MKSSNTESHDMLEYPFLTLSKYPPGFIRNIGGTVAARSVKLLERVPNPDEPETRDLWWTELRMEIRSHTKALGCNFVVGYSEVTSISDEICILSATGTAVVVNFNITDSSGKSIKNQKDGEDNEIDLNQSETKTYTNFNEEMSMLDENVAITSFSEKIKNSKGPVKVEYSNCSICHIPYQQMSIPYKTIIKKCTTCKEHRVPDIILATIEVPDSVRIIGRGCLLNAHVFRFKRDLRTEHSAKEISDSLPFLEYELHRQLINKLKVNCKNAIFGFKSNVIIGERVITLLATGTAVYIASLPAAVVPKIVAGNLFSNREKLGDIQKVLSETFDRNFEIFKSNFKFNLTEDSEIIDTFAASDTEDSDEEFSKMELSCGNKDACVLEIDDIEDMETIASLTESSPPDGFYVVNTQSVPGLTDSQLIRGLQMFTQVWRSKFTSNQCNISFAKHFQRILQGIFYKLRRMIPCAICNLQFKLVFPEMVNM